MAGCSYPIRLQSSEDKIIIIYYVTDEEEPASNKEKVVKFEHKNLVLHTI